MAPSLAAIQIPAARHDITQAGTSGWRECGWRQQVLRGLCRHSGGQSFQAGRSPHRTPRHEAKAAGFNPLTVETVAWDHKAYYPGAHELRIRVTGDTDTGKLLGAQIVGHWRSEVAKRIDIFAAGLFHGMSMEDFSDLDLSYTPPLSSPWDPAQLGAQEWCRKRRLCG
ncbi:MAG: hypothetical protein WCC87_06085 [Candidatus Korobacteraceae bacterium]